MLLVLEHCRRLSPGKPFHDQLVAAGHPSTPLATLRKRGQRALERLRREYHQQE